MFNKILLSLILLSGSTIANAHGILKIINNVKVPEEFMGIVHVEINHEKKMVRANNQFVTVGTPDQQPTQFDLTGMILGNTYQTNINPGCHIQLWIESGTERTVEIHTPPDDEAGYGKELTCIVR